MLEVPRGPQRQHCSPHLLNPPELLREPVDGTRGLGKHHRRFLLRRVLPHPRPTFRPFIIGERAVEWRW